MDIEQAVTRLLASWLPAGDQARLATDVISWLGADLPPAQRQKITIELAPKLLERIREGQFGLGAVAYYHLLRLPLLRRLRPSFAPQQPEALGSSTIAVRKP